MGIKITVFMELFRAVIWGITITVTLIVGISMGIILKPQIAKMLKKSKRK